MIAPHAIKENFRGPNVGWGSPRIVGGLRKLGINIAGSACGEVSGVLQEITVTNVGSFSRAYQVFAEYKHLNTNI